MSDIQKTIVVNGKEYVTQPRTSGCAGCVAFYNAIHGGAQCHSFPPCKDVIFVDKEASAKALAGSHTPLAEVSRLCDAARADGHVKGYAEGLADKQAEWDKWKAENASYMEAYSSRLKGYNAGFDRGLLESRAAHRTSSVLDPSGSSGVYGVARTSDPTTSHKAANKLSLRKAGRIADLILVELRNANLTGSELAARTGVALNSITPRFAQLSRKGLIHAAGGSGRETMWAIGNGIKA